MDLILAFFAGVAVATAVILGNSQTLVRAYRQESERLFNENIRQKNRLFALEKAKTSTNYDPANDCYWP